MSTLRKHILLVDDEQAVITALKLVLQALGFEVSEFTYPEQAVEFLTRPEKKVDLILCDLKMPKVTGLDLLRSSMECRPNLPFILMSAHATQAEISQAYALGAKGYLAKPFTPQEFKVVAQGLLG